MTKKHVDWPHYQCHKNVQAVQVKKIDPNPPKDLYEGGEPAGAVLIYFVESEFAPTWFAPEWIEKFKPEVGGYLVLYEDGYLSYSPAKAFIGGYDKI